MEVHAFAPKCRQLRPSIYDIQGACLGHPCFLETPVSWETPEKMLSSTLSVLAF